MATSDAERRATREAADWFGRLRSRTVATEELTEFATWRRDPLNRRCYERIEALWDDAGAVRDEPEVEEALRRALRRRGLRRAIGRSIRHPATATVAVGFAALAAVIAFVPLPVPWAERGYLTGVGERSVVRLADGTRVRLDTATGLIPRLAGGERRVELFRGQAYFDVRHDPAHPFVVDAGGGTTVTALGTRFDVERDANTVKVTLFEGSVEVANAESRASLRLRPGQEVLLTNGMPGRVSDAAGVGVPNWIAGRLSFRETPLGTAVAELNRYTPRSLRVRPEDADRPVSGDFSTDDPDGFVAAADAIFGKGAVTRDAGG